MHVILRTISSFFPHQKILFLSKVMPLKICDTSPGLSNSIDLFSDAEQIRNEPLIDQLKVISLELNNPPKVSL